ncbi:MAG: hypothetical protein PHF53_09695 [Bacteroidales bacterium]|nr:hypothetical protein [Bacteroidales bacterium]
MKTLIEIKKLILAVCILLVGSIGIQAQVGELDQQGDMTTCLNSTEPYGVVLTPGSTYEWSVIPASAGTIVFPEAGVTNLITVTWTQVGTHVLQVVETNEHSCVGSPVTINVIVNDLPYFADITASGVCSGSPIGVILPGTSDNGISISSWDITDVAVATGLTGTPTKQDGITDPNQISEDSFINLTNNPLNVVYTIIPHSATCQGPAFTITVSISSAPVVDPITASVCSENPIGINLPVISKNGLTLDQWDVSATVDAGLVGTPTEGTGLTDAAAIAGDLFTNTTSGALNVIYTVIPHSGSCVGEAFTITVTIDQQPTVENVGPLMACSGDVISVVLEGTSTNGLTLTTFDITVAKDPELIGDPTTGTITELDGIAGDQFTNPTDTVREVVYTITPYAGTCQGSPFTVTVRIAPSVKTSPVWHK